MIDRLLRKAFNAESPPPMIWEPEVHGKLYPDRPYFLTRVRQGMNKLPLELQDKFAKAGHKVYLARHPTDFAPLLPKSDQHLREEKGISVHEGLKINAGSVLGMFAQYDGHIIIPQKPENTLANILLNGDLEYVVVHEAGHLFGFTTIPGQYLSLTPEFSEMALEELRSIPDLKSIIPSTPNGANIINALADADLTRALRELLADLFAENILGRDNMSRFTPKSAAWVRHKIEEVCEEYRQDYAAQLSLDTLEAA